MKKVLILFLIASIILFAMALLLKPTPFLVSLTGVMLGFNLSLSLAVFVGSNMQQKHLVKIEKLEKDFEESIMG